MAEKLIVYDSYFGNTEKIAQAMAEALEDAVIKRVTEVTPQDLEDVKYLLVGSPTRAFSPSPATTSYIKSIAPGALKGVRAGAFDTRIPKDQTDSGFLRFMINLFGYADKKIAKALIKAGADLVLENTGFGVKGTEGPLVEGELDRAKDWALRILNQ